MKVSYGAELDARQRMQLAKVCGHGQRLATGSLKHVAWDDAVDQLLDITEDPVVLGIALGGALCNRELDEWPHVGPLIDLYRAAGADEQVAAVNLEWHRQRPTYRNR